MLLQECQSCVSVRLKVHERVKSLFGPTNAIKELLSPYWFSGVSRNITVTLNQIENLHKNPLTFSIGIKFASNTNNIKAPLILYQE